MKKASQLFLFIIFLTANLFAAQTKNSKPNIIFILVDDLGKEWVSCYGAQDIETPKIDQLAKSGLLFNNFYVMPQCTPTRVSFLSGQYPFRHGWVNHWDVPRWGGGAHFDETLNPCIAFEMKKAGYKTCVAGKWQIDDFRVEPDAMQKCGFDNFCMWTGGEAKNPVSNERYFNPYIFTTEGSKTYRDEFGPDIFKNFIIDFILSNKDTSFFIYYPMVLTHTPLVNTPDEVSETNLGKHKAMVRYTDKITGEIIETLHSAGIENNTIIIWTTDNGTAKSIKGKRNGELITGGKAETTESGVNVPFIVSWPGKIKPGTSEALSDITDMFPTLLDLANVNLSKTDYKTDGFSIKNVLLNGNKKSERKWIMAMGGQNNARLTENGVENEYNFRDRVIRNERFKIYIGTSGNPTHFYDLETDNFEKKNLVNELSTEVQQSNFKFLYSVCKTFPEKDNDPIYKPNPKQNWDVQISAKSQVWKK